MYTLIASGFLVSDTGIFYPASRSHPSASQVIDELLAAGAVTEANDGTLTFKPKSNVLTIEGDVDINTAKVQAYDTIDQAAGAARAKYVTVAAGQEMTYMSKVLEANLIVGMSGVSTVNIDSYPWVKSQVLVNRGLTTLPNSSISIYDAQEAAQSILSTANQWAMIGGEIERIRLSSKKTIDALPISTAAQRKASLTDLRTNILPTTLASLGAI